MHSRTLQQTMQVTVTLVTTFSRTATSVLKSGPRTGKKLATKPGCNRFGPDCGCGPEGFEIGPVVVAEA